jgi:hypothetical protein
MKGAFLFDTLDIGNIIYIIKLNSMKKNSNLGKNLQRVYDGER